MTTEVLFNMNLWHLDVIILNLLNFSANNLKDLILITGPKTGRRKIILLITVMSIFVFMVSTVRKKSMNGQLRIWTPAIKHGKSVLIIFQYTTPVRIVQTMMLIR
ncbi:hypothetical protein SDC9_182249 [bioreactor metagenome]|uniref:Transmembrane protein n=1 Tax=bioreactor metagenome TaxID=1076179 RepID=A0A645H6Y5_9ZZZZ